MEEGRAVAGRLLTDWCSTPTAAALGSGLSRAVSDGVGGFGDLRVERSWAGAPCFAAGTPVRCPRVWRAGLGRPADRTPLVLRAAVPRAVSAVGCEAQAVSRGSRL